MRKIVTRDEFEDLVAKLIRELERDSRLQDENGVDYPGLGLMTSYLQAYGRDVPPLW
jgi:hypothetical protein